MTSEVSILKLLVQIIQLIQSYWQLSHMPHSITGRPQKIQSFIIFSKSNIINDFMVEENDMLEITCCSFKQIRSSMTNLWGKVWPLYHFTPTQGKFPMHGCILNRHVRLRFLACGSGWTLETSVHHRFYIALEWNNIGVKLCHATLTWMIGFGWNYNSLSLRYHSL